MSGNTIILQFTSDGVWVMAFRGQAREHRIVLSVFSPLQDGRLSADVMGRLKSAVNIKRSQVVLILPQRQVIFKYFTLPSRNMEELRRMVGLQIGQGLAFSPQEIIYDVALGGEDPQGSSRVIAAVARQKTVEECIAIAAASGLAPSRCVVDAFAVAGWFGHLFPAYAGSWVLIADAQAQGVQFCVCHNNRLVFARGIPWPQTSDASALAVQVDVTVEALKRACPQAAVSKILVTGVSRYWGVLKSVLVAKLGAAWEEVHADAAGHEVDKEVSLCAALGTVFAKDLGPDLMPSHVHSVKNVRREQGALLRVFAAVALLVLSLFFWTRQNLAHKDNELAAVRRQMTQIKGPYEAARRNLMLYEQLAGHQNKRVIIAELYKQLYEALPESVVLTNVQYTDGNLTILGQTRESADVGAVQKAMMASSMFKDVTLQYANRPQRLAMEYTEFKMVCRLRTEEGEAK